MLDGTLEVQPQAVTVLADTAVRAEDLDEGAAQEAKRHAEEQIANPGADFDHQNAALQLEEAIAQLRLDQTDVSIYANKLDIVTIEKNVSVKADVLRFLFC